MPFQPVSHGTMATAPGATGSEAVRVPTTVVLGIPAATFRRVRAGTRVAPLAGFVESNLGTALWVAITVLASRRSNVRCALFEV